MADPTYPDNPHAPTNPFGISTGGLGSYLSPTFVDIDNDGVQDLFIGNSNGGTYFFENTGTASSPSFTNPVNPPGITGVGSHATPSFADIDGDGDWDAFVGKGAGDVVFFRNIGTAANPSFSQIGTNPFGLANVGNKAAPTFADLDNDGDLDAIIGNQAGNILYFQNTGTASAPTFAAAVTNPFGLTTVGASGWASPTLADVDGDGDLDLYVGRYMSGQSPLFFRNTGTASAPSFAAGITNAFGITTLGSYSAKPDFVDIDGDGDLELFVGTWNTGIRYFQEAQSVADTTPPVFQSAATSADGTKVILTYDGALNATTAAAGAFAVTTGGSGNTVTAVTVNGSTIELTLTTAVTNGQSVTVAYTDPSAGDDANAIQDAAGNDAADLASTSVTNNVPDTTPPVFQSAATSADGTKVILTYDGALNATTAAAGAFAVTTGGSGNVVTAVTVNGSTIELTLTTAVTNGESVTVAYTDPTAGDDANAIQDAAGNDAADLASTSVTNNVPDTTPPAFQSAATSADGTKVILTYDGALNATTAAAGAFAVTTGGSGNTVTAVTVNGSTIELTLTTAVTNGQSVTVAYTDPTAGNDANAIQDAAGNDAVSLTAQSVTNNVPDTTPPAFQSAATSADGTKVILTYDGALNATTAAAGAFAVTTGGSGNTVTAVTVNGSTIELTLTTAVTNGQAVTVAYTDPTAGDDANAIQDAAGNDAADIATTTVTNTVPVLNNHPVITSNGAGATASINVPENSTAVTQVTAIDADTGQLPTFSITGGADQAKFNINTTSGALTFASAPNFEAPTDADTNNSYIVEVTASDGHGGTDVQTITVNVTDVNETTPTPTPTPTPNPTPTPTPTPTPNPTPTPSGTVDGMPVTQTTTTGTNGSTTTTITVPVVTGTRTEDPTTTNGSLADIPLAQDGNGNPIVQVSLPVGVGLTSETTSGGNQTLREMLINASQPRSDANSFAEILQQGIDQYVPSVGDPSQVTVRTVTLTVPTGTTTAPSQPIVITGASGTGENDAAHPLRQEALVIDARNLPLGTVLDLSNVEFAIIIGPSHIVGGNGQNYVIGDGNQQYIVLGAEDDVLHGGGGDDTIGSKGGDDQLFGDEGDDTVVGGIGNDTLHGGDGDDILQGGASDAGTWTFALNVEGEMVARFTPMDTDLADGVGITFTGDWSTSLVDSRVSIVGQDYGTLSDIALLYHAVTHQFADVDVLTAAAESGRSSGEWAQLAYDHFIANNTLFQLFGVTSDAVTMRALVNQVFGSSTNDQVTSGLTFINEGGSWADYLLQLARQSEHKAQLTDDEGLMQLANPMTLTETGWSADAGDNTLNGGAGNDLLVGGTGNNVLDGGEGIDLAAFVGTLSDYTLGLQQTSTSQVNLVIKNVHTGNTTTLLNVEGVKIGGDIYTGNANLATLVVGDDRPLDEFAQLVGLADLEAIGVPQSWL